MNGVVYAITLSKKNMAFIDKNRLTPADPNEPFIICYCPREGDPGFPGNGNMGIVIDPYTGTITLISKDGGVELIVSADGISIFNGQTDSHAGPIRKLTIKPDGTISSDINNLSLPKWDRDYSTDTEITDLTLVPRLYVDNPMPAPAYIDASSENATLSTVSRFNVINSGEALATLSLLMPPAPFDGQEVELYFLYAATTLNLDPTPNAFISDAINTATAGQYNRFKFLNNIGGWVKLA